MADDVPMHHDDSLLVAEAVSAFGRIPAELSADSGLRSYDIRIVDVRDGQLVAESLDDEPPLVGTELSIRTTSGQRAAHEIDCVVSHQRGHRVDITIRG